MIGYLAMSIAPPVFSMIFLKDKIFHCSSKGTIQKENNKERLCFALLVLFLAVMIGLEPFWGIEASDYINYGYHFSIVKNYSLLHYVILVFLKPISSESLYWLMVKIGTLIFPNYEIYHFVLIVVIIVLFCMSIKKLSDQWWYVIWIWVASGSFRYINNLTSQMLSIAILFYFGTKYLKNKRFMKYAIVCLIAASFHKSAILFIPLYFLFTYPIRGKARIFFFIIPLTCVVLYNYYAPFLSDVLSLIGYNIYIDTIIKTYTWKILILPAIYVAITLIYLKNNVKDSDESLVWEQVLFIFFLANMMSMINNMAIRMTLFPEMFVILMFSHSMLDDSISKNRIILIVLTLIASIALTIYLH